MSLHETGRDDPLEPDHMPLAKRPLQSWFLKRLAGISLRLEVFRHTDDIASDSDAVEFCSIDDLLTSDVAAITPDTWPARENADPIDPDLNYQIKIVERLLSTEEGTEEFLTTRFKHHE